MVGGEGDREHTIWFDVIWTKMRHYEHFDEQNIFFYRKTGPKIIIYIQFIHLYIILQYCCRFFISAIDTAIKCSFYGLWNAVSHLLECIRVSFNGCLTWSLRLKKKLHRTKQKSEQVLYCSLLICKKKQVKWGIYDNRNIAITLT